VSDELWAFLNSQFLGILVLLGTLIVLVIYAYDTRRIARAAIEQRDLMHRPILVISSLMRRSAREEVSEAIFTALDKAAGDLDAENRNPTVIQIAGPVGITNIGTGPALEVLVSAVVPGRREAPVWAPHIKAGQGWSFGHIAHAGPWELFVRYKSITGAKFLSHYVLDGAVIREFRRESGA